MKSMIVTANNLEVLFWICSHKAADDLLFNSFQRDFM